LYFLDVFFPDFNCIYPLSITVHKETKAKAFSIKWDLDYLDASSYQKKTPTAAFLFYADAVIYGAKNGKSAAKYGNTAVRPFPWYLLYTTS